MNDYVLTFRNTHDAMDEEERLMERGLALKMIPTPRGISSECGFSIKVSSSETAFTESLTDDRNRIERIYLIYEKNRRKHYEEIYRRQDSSLSSTGHQS